ncbi:MAG TPA: hypothetical protein VKD28_10430 [Gemmatimonadales bacterium]|nr:hypothetical protein [Gemmatimonadales bacterium]
MQRFLLVCSALGLLACGDSSGPPSSVPDAQLHVIVQDTAAPALDSTVARFWAKVGEGRGLRIGYQPPADTGEDFVRFEVPGDGLLRHPDGSSFQPGDSIQITLTVVDPTRFLVRFEPAGLQFSSKHPARLKFHYLHADHDFDGNGVINAADSTIEHTLDLWRREIGTSVWFRVGSVKFEALQEIDANILSFSEYAIAW